MRLVVDCFKLVRGHGKSIGIYSLTQSLLIHLVEEQKKRQDGNEIVVLGNSYNRKDFDIDGVTFVEIKKDPTKRIVYTLWELFGVNVAARKNHADRVLFPRGFRPFVCAIKDTVIIHDMIPFFYDENFHGAINPIENAYIMWRLKASIRRANQVVTISKSSYTDIKKYVKLAVGLDNKLRIIHNGINEVKMPENIEKYNYIVATTTSMPHKNAVGILKAYEVYYTRQKKAHRTPMDLHIIGIDNSFLKKLGGITNEMKEHIFCHSYVADYTEVCRLVAQAKISLFLSLAEGFGFPPIEAMQLKTPVICSDRTSLPEVVGQAAILVNPDKPIDVAIAIENLEKDENRQRELVEEGTKNYKRFLWDSRAALYYDLLFEDGRRELMIQKFLRNRREGRS